MTVAVTPPARDSVYEPALRDHPLRQMHESDICSTPHPPSLVMLPAGLVADAAHPAVQFSPSASGTMVVPPATKFDTLVVAASSTTSSQFTNLSPPQLELRPELPITATCQTASPPVIVSAVSTLAQVNTFRSPACAAAASATLPVVRRRTSDKSHLPMAVGESKHFVQSLVTN